MKIQNKVRQFIYTGPLASALSGFLEDMRLSGRIYNAEGYCLGIIDDKSKNMNCNENCLPRELVEELICKREYESHKTWANRTFIIRRLAKYMNTHGYAAYETPIVVHNKPTDFVPHIFTDSEMARLFDAADRLPSCTLSPNRVPIVALLLRMLYGCGLRLSEALNLKIKDVDLGNGVLTILESKFEKSRYVPMTPELTEKCREYVLAVRKDCGANDWLLPAPDRGPYSRRAINTTFRKLLVNAGIPYNGDGPRLHDLRHTFSVHCLKKWVIAGSNINIVLPLLSAYLGHKNLNGTQHYLRLTADMYPDITSALEKKLGAIVPGEGEK